MAFDIAQGKYVVYSQCPDGREEKLCMIFNRRKECEQRWKRISKTRGMEEVVVGFELTGTYAEPVVHYLMQKEVKLVQVNPRLQDVVELGRDGLSETLENVGRGGEWERSVHVIVAGLIGKQVILRSIRRLRRLRN